MSEIPPPPAAPAPIGGGSASKNGLGTWALILGIASIVCCSLLFGVIAIVLGLQSKKAGAEGLATNANLGNVGFILGIIGSVLSLIAGVLWLFGAFSVPFLESAY